MRIVVLNGSPKGEKSITMQSVGYVAKKRPDTEWRIVNVAHRIGRLESRREEFQAVIEEVRSADAVLWGFPLYILLVCSQYKRFIELVFERNAQDAFRGKYAASLSTSIHFFDQCAHRYIRAVCDDLGMEYVDSFPAHMRDLFEEGERERLLQFADDFLGAIQTKRPTARMHDPLPRSDFEYVPGPARSPAEAGSRRVVVLTDAREGQANVQKMIERFTAAIAGEVEVINLHDIDIKGGCLGCCRCGLDYECAYEGKDGYVEFYNGKVTPADIIVFAGATVDRHLSWKWRQFLDRSFFNTHTPTLIGKQVAFLISGPVRQMPSLRETLEGWAEWQHAHLVDIVTDEDRDSERIDGLLDALAMKLVHHAETGYVRPPTFLQVGGMKLFRDDIYGQLRLVFQADYAAYRRLGYMDFPQGDLRTRLTNAVASLATSIPPIRRRFRTMVKDKMVEVHRRVVEDE